MPSPVQKSAAAMAGKNGHSLISSDKFRQLFHALIESQMLNQHLRSSGKAGAADALNREAGPAGLVLDLRPEDSLLLPSSTHFAHRVKGLPLKQLLDQPPAKSSRPEMKLGKRLSDSIACALNNRLEGNGAIVLTIFELPQSGDGDAGLSAYDEIFAIALANRLPILFVAENHGGVSDSSAFRETHSAFPYISVDAHDVVAVYRVAQESIVRTRDGGGPAVIELASVSLEMDDPVEKMHRYLLGKGLPAGKWKAEAVRKFEKQLAAACLLGSDPLA
jgi:hypothetical protein